MTAMTSSLAASATTRTGEAIADLLSDGDNNDLILGGDGNDYIFGGDGADNIYGVYDQDTLFGGGGDDAIHGGEADDTLDGSDGAKRSMAMPEQTSASMGLRSRTVRS
jgi:Ca2+-binding RTX toxin-like protein